MANDENQLKRYKQAIKDARYIFRTYRKRHPDEAWETIRKIIHDPKLRATASPDALPDNDD